jgi:hypothetical protein
MDGRALGHVDSWVGSNAAPRTATSRWGAVSVGQSSASDASWKAGGPDHLWFLFQRDFCSFY